MEKPLISIIVPIFNVETYVSECVESILRQSHENIQVILVDDGSTDKSGELCDRYASMDSRIEVIRQPNGGLVRARKSGLERAAGEYIGFVDGDDCIEPEMYERLLQAIREHDADFVHSGYIYKGVAYVPLTGKTVIFSDEYDRKSFLRTAVLGGKECVSPSIWSKLFKAGFIKECYGKIPDSVSIGEDLLNLCVCVMLCDKIVLLDEAYYHYRHREGSITNVNDLNVIKDILNLYGNAENMLQGRGYDERLHNLMVEYAYQLIRNKIRGVTSDYFQLARYYCDDVESLLGKRVIIYGAGAVGRDYYSQISRYTDCDIIAWADACPEKYDYPHIKLHGPEVLDTAEFDILVIAVRRQEVAGEIRGRLLSMGVEGSKIFWLEPRLYQPEI